MLVGMVSIYLPCIVTFAQLLHFWCGIMDAIWDPVHLLLPSKAKKEKSEVFCFRKLFTPTVRKKIASDREKPLEIWGFRPRIFKILRSPEQVIRTVKGQSKFSTRMLFYLHLINWNTNGNKYLGCRNPQEQFINGEYFWYRYIVCSNA